MGWFAVLVALVVFSTVLGEELLFRGLLLPRIVHSTASVFAVIVVPPRARLDVIREPAAASRDERAFP